MRISLILFLASSVLAPAFAQHHDHGSNNNTDAASIERPKVFLDKSPRIVEYQLKRLDNQRLLLVERKTDDNKYVPVYAAILSRVGMSPKFREEAIEAIVSLTGKSPTEVLLDAIDKFDPDDRDQRRTARQLGAILLRQSDEQLRTQRDAIVDAAESENATTRAIAVAAMIVSAQRDAAIATLTGDDDAKLAFLASIQLIPKTEVRSAMRPQVVDLVANDVSAEVRRAAITALGFIPTDQEQSFELVAPLISNPSVRDAAVRTLLKIPARKRASESSTTLAGKLVDHAENTPPADRTSNAFIDAMQLADQLIGRLPSDVAKSYRSRLDAVTVRVVRIKTVEEEMRYDIPYFAVQAGKSVQIILENHDLMPHNLVITVPGALKEVAQLGLQTGPNNGWKGLQYVPESDKVLHATQMVPADQQARLTFTAPTEPGEYPYVCTFPQHWYRMYGVMVVVEDLDAWMKNPVEPANPIGSNRTFVQAWTVDDLKDELDSGIRGRSPEIGQKLFAEASCAGCHKVSGEGGVIGPELTDVISRWKGDLVGVLREIVDPSHKVDAKYAMQRVLTFDGRTFTGVLQKEDDDHVYLLVSPEAQEPIVIPQDDIDAMVPSNVSMMPKALLDQYTKDEVFEIMGYLQSVDPKK